MLYCSFCKRRFVLNLSYTNVGYWKCWCHFTLKLINSVWPSNVMCRHRSRPTLPQVMACWHRAITWTNADLSSKEFCGTHRKGLTEEVLLILIRNMFELFNKFESTTTYSFFFIKCNSFPKLHENIIEICYPIIVPGAWSKSKQPMMTSSNGNIFRVTGHLCGEFTGPRWISRTKASDAELSCFLWSAPE